MTVDYAQYHRKRFDYLLNLVDRYTTGRQDPDILEVGAGPFTQLLRNRFQKVATVGLPLETTYLVDRPSEGASQHFEFNLIQTLDPKGWPKIGRYDVIVFAEVLEHLFFSVDHVLGFLKSCLKPGGVILCQTPNGVNLNNRLKMLLGRNPIAPYGISLVEPGHFREWTKQELIDLGERAGLAIELHEFKNYFSSMHPLTPLLDAIGLLVPSLRRGQTIVFRNAGGKAAELPAVCLKNVQTAWFGGASESNY